MFQPVADILITWISKPVKITRESLKVSNLGIMWGLSMFDVILIVLAVMQGSSDTLDCALDRTWLQWFRQKSEADIKIIQDRLLCCGLRSDVDRAWPFPDATHHNDACKLLYHRDDPCMARWQSEAYKALYSFSIVGSLSLLVKVCFLSSAEASDPCLLTSARLSSYYNFISKDFRWRSVSVAYGVKAVGFQSQSTLTSQHRRASEKRIVTEGY